MLKMNRRRDNLMVGWTTLADSDGTRVQYMATTTREGVDGERVLSMWEDVGRRTDGEDESSKGRCDDLMDVGGRFRWDESPTAGDDDARRGSWWSDDEFVVDIEHHLRNDRTRD